MQRLPPKPFPKFPLFPHRNGQWAKKIAGRLDYFGPWRWPDQAAYQLSWRAAEKKYNDWREAIARGQLFVANPRAITLEELCDLYLAPQHARAERNEIKPRYFSEVRRIVTRFRNDVGRHRAVAEVEADPQPIHDWLKETNRYGWALFNKTMKLVRGVFIWAAKSPDGPLKNEPFKCLHLFTERPLREFRRQRRHEREAGAVYTVSGEELRTIVNFAPQPLRSMVLVAYFAGYGNTDCGELPLSAMTVLEKPEKLFIRGQLEEIPAGWARMDFPRPKSEVDRFALLPPFVVDSLRSAEAVRPKPANKAWKNRRFFTRGGQRVCYEVIRRDEANLIKDVSVVDMIGQQWYRLLARIGRCASHGWQVRVPFKRAIKEAGKATVNRRLVCPVCGELMQPFPKRGFYSLRHTSMSFAAASGASNDTRKLFEGHMDSDNPMRQTFYTDPTQLHDLLLIARELMSRAGFTENERLPDPPIWTAAPAPARLAATVAAASLV